MGLIQACYCDVSSSGGTRTHSIRRSKRLWSANCLPSHFRFPAIRKTCFSFVLVAEFIKRLAVLVKNLFSFRQRFGDYAPTIPTVGPHLFEPFSSFFGVVSVPVRNYLLSRLRGSRATINEGTRTAAFRHDVEVVNV